MRMPIAFLIAGLALGCARLPTVATVEGPSEYQAEVDTARRVIGSLNSINRDDLQTAFVDWADDVEVIVMGPRMERLANNRRDWIEDMRTRREALNLRVGADRVLVSSPDRWVLQGVAIGTHRDTFQGRAATGESFGVPFLQIGEVQDGRTTRVLMFDSELSALTQIGVMPGDYPRRTFPLSAEIVVGPRNVRHEQTVARVLDAMERGDWSVVAQHVTSDIEQHRHDLGLEVTGPDGVREVAEQSPVTGVSFGPQQMLSSGDWVVAWGPVSGRLTGAVGPVDGQGERVELYSAQVYRFDGDRIAEVHVYGDPMQILRQLDAAAAVDLP